MMDFREYRMVEEPPLELDSVEVLDLCVRRGGGNEEHRIPIKEERSSPTTNTEQIIHYSTTSNNVPKYADTAHSFHVPPQIQPIRPDAISFGTAIRSSGSPGVIRPHPTMATPNVQYFPLQQEQKQQQTLGLLHQHLLQPNSPPPSMTSECHIALSSSSPASRSPSSSDCSSIPATSPTVPVVTQNPNPLSLGYMLQTPTAFPILPPAIPPLQSPVLNSSSKGGNNGKPQRPFKAINVSTSHNVLCSQDYLQFRQRMLEKIERRIGKRNNKNNQPKRTASPSQQPSSSDGNIQSTGSDGGVSGTSVVKDAAYRERRKKNNEAAKRSRDARREKEDELAIRTSFLEQENMILKCQVISLEKKLGIYPSANTLRWQI